MNTPVRRSGAARVLRGFHSGAILLDHRVGTYKLKFHWDQFPRNFPVADVTEKSPTSYEEVGRVGRVASLL